jgi:DNA polymerase-3 subunit gamma/tau
MSESTSLYRRHRPGSFDEVVGQTHVVRTLRNAVEQGKVHHAYLFVGSRGTGKTSMAKILARSLNCERGGPTVTPCGECESCLTIAAGTSVDVIEMDAASNRSVDDVRDLRERVAYAPAGGRWKVYILDEAHMLTKEAWNAFLKTLEEPPPNTVFVLATTESHKVMATIADRCQRFDFQRPSLEQISEVLTRVAAAESIEVDEGALAMIARSAQGSFRDALGTLDQLVAFGGSHLPVRPRPPRPPAPPADHPDHRRGPHHLRSNRHRHRPHAGPSAGDRGSNAGADDRRACGCAHCRPRGRRRTHGRRDSSAQGSKTRSGSRHRRTSKTH